MRSVMVAVVVMVAIIVPFVMKGGVGDRRM